MLDLSARHVIPTVVEAMLPRFSDHKLGLQMTIQLHVADHGYGKDGNTRERRALEKNRMVHFIFVRPSNYTKVFVWLPDDKPTTVGLDLWPDGRELEWNLESDHDSCWRDGADRVLTKEYQDMLKPFEGRKISGVPMNPYRDTSQFHCFDREPRYVMLTKFERVHPQKDRFSDEGRIYRIQYETITFAKLTQVASPDTKQMIDSGIFIVGSEDHRQYVDSAQRIACAKKP